MKYIISLVVAFFFYLIFYGVYKSNESFVTITAYYCLGICIGRIAFRVADWIDRITTKDKEE